MVVLVVLALVVLAGAFYVTYLFSWCAGYDAAISGSMRGSPLWRQFSDAMLTTGRDAGTMPEDPVASYKE